MCILFGVLLKDTHGWRSVYAWLYWLKMKRRDNKKKMGHEKDFRCSVGNFSGYDSYGWLKRWLWTDDPRQWIITFANIHKLPTEHPSYQYNKMLFSFEFFIYCILPAHVQEQLNHKLPSRYNYWSATEKFMVNIYWQNLQVYFVRQYYITKEFMLVLQNDVYRTVKPSALKANWPDIPFNLDSYSSLKIDLRFMKIFSTLKHYSLSS